MSLRQRQIQHILILIAAVVSLQYVTIGQWRKNIGAKIQRTPSGAATSIRYGRANTFTPQVRYLPSEGRYISSARGLTPSESRALRMASGPLPSSGRYSHLAPSPSAKRTIRPYSYTTITRSPTERRIYNKSYQRSYTPLQTSIKIPKPTYSKKRTPAKGSIRYGMSSRKSLTAKYKEPKLTKPAQRTTRIKSSGYIGGSIRYGSSTKNQPILKSNRSKTNAPNSTHKKKQKVNSKISNQIPPKENK